MDNEPKDDDKLDEFTIAYSCKTFDGYIRAGTFTVDADIIESVQRDAMKLVLAQIKDNYGEEKEYFQFIHNINLSVKAKTL